MQFATATSILLLIDLQARLMPAIHDGEAVIRNATRLAEAARLLEIPVLGTEQNPAGLGGNLPALKEMCSATLSKQHFDATREEAWATFLTPGRRDIVVAGCEAHVCVLQTVLGLRRAGHAVRLVGDAIGARTTINRDAALGRAAHHGAELVTTEMVVFEWLESCDHPAFRAALKLVK